MLRFLLRGSTFPALCSSLLVFMVMFGLFAMIGGIITAAILSRKKTGLEGMRDYADPKLRVIRTSGRFC